MDLIVLEKRRGGGVSAAVTVSLVLHSLMIAFFVWRAGTAPPAAKDTPIARYVQLMTENPREFVEAPGPAIDKAPLSAPLSNANRKASTPQPTGDQPTTRPGDGSGLYTPPSSSAPPAPQPRPATPSIDVPAQQPGSVAQATTGTPSTTNDPNRLTYREPAQASLAGGIDWRNAIKQVGQQPSHGGGEAADGDITGGGGEKGYAEQGPLSFETRWYDWGDYAQSMVQKIRVQWYANMPQLLRTGMKGVVTIRFTIQRNGTITDISVMESSGVPPYDFAARKAIELASPLLPLPKDFPNANERVTAMFYYNMQPVSR